MIIKFLKEKKAILLLTLILAYFLIFFHLGKNFLVSFDEAWYAEISRQMIYSGNFLKMTWNQQPFFDKPPLFFWLQIISFKIFGINEFGARFFSALSGFLVIYLTFLIGSKFSKNIGIFSAIILVSLPLFINQARMATLEMLVTFFITLAMFYLFEAQKSQKKILFFFLASALAIFTKGIIGLIPILTLAVIFITFRENGVSLKNYYKGFFMLLLINLPWYLLINFFYKEKHLILPAFELARFKQVNPATGINFFYYLKVLKTALKFWIILFPLAFLNIVFISLRKKGKKKLVLLFWFLITYFSFSIPALKNSWYLTPIYPPTAIILGLFIDKIYPQKNFNLKIGFLFLIFLLNFLLYKNQFWVPETVSNEVKLLKIVQKNSQGNEILYLDDNYHPLAVYYSQRKVFPIRFNRGSFNTLEKEDLNLDKKTFFLTNTENIEELKEDLKNFKIKEEKILGDKILISVYP